MNSLQSIYPKQLWNKWFTLRSVDRDERFRERTIRGIMLILAFAAIVIGANVIALGAFNRLSQTATLFFGALLIMAIVNRGHILFAGWATVALAMIYAVFSLIQVGYWAPGVVIALTLGLLQGIILVPLKSARYLPFIIVFLYTAATFWLDKQGVHSPLPDNNPFAHPLSAALTFSVSILALSGTQFYLIQEFNNHRQELKNLIETLEDRVLERTRDLQVAANVSQQVTQILDIHQLLPLLTEQTRAAFDLYHVSIFLLEDNGETLRLQAGTGSAGPAMVNLGKQFQIEDQGLVPLTARQHLPQMVNDVQHSADYSQNPHLPNTRSEVALPMLIGSTLVGVLDLQSDRVDNFTNADIRVFTTLAEQIAVAVRNAYLFAEMQAARSEAEKANSVKSQFLASMSHELRTPLNAILNFTQFVSSGMIGPVNAEQLDMLQKVTHSGKHLLGLINDVLDISKIEAGALKLFVEENVDLAKEAQAALAAARALIGDKRITLETSIAADLPLMVGDKRRIRQILLNLMSNACKFTEEGTIRVVVEQQAGQLMFSVEDSGPGIADEDAALVFETFRQTTNGLRQGEGTGLGLPISRRLAEAHGGRLWFEGNPGRGAHFHVSLPVRDAELVQHLTPPKEQTHVA